MMAKPRNFIKPIKGLRATQVIDALLEKPKDKPKPKPKGS